MFALGIRYLNGWAMATHPADRDRAEWPPHPDRVFMALAAGHFETEAAAEERHALEWLQTLPSPALAVADAQFRDIVTSYVPVNDTEITRPKVDSPAALAKRIAERDAVTTIKAAKERGFSILPEFRSRQARPFPVAIPNQSINTESRGGMPCFYLIWDTAELPSNQTAAMASLCSKVTSVGHSASFVQAWVEPSPPPPTLVPIDGINAQHHLRVSGNSRLHQLESRYKAGLRPAASLWQGYGSVVIQTKAPSAPQSVFDPTLLILRRVDGQRFGLETTLQLTQALRDTVMSKCPVQPPPAWISGHAPDGNPVAAAHLAFLPLPDIGHQHAAGHLLGIALAIPRDVPETEQHRCLTSALFYDLADEAANPEHIAGTPRTLRLTMGRTGAWQVELADDDARYALCTSTWTATHHGATRWATATPIVFDRHPKETWSSTDSPRAMAQKQAAYWADVESMIAQACVNIGLPKPVEVTAQPASSLIGSPSSGHMPRMFRKDGTQKRQTHAVILFSEPIIGPVLLGAGRYRGYGACRPLLGDGAA